MSQIPTYGMLSFNVQDGFCEAVLRGYRAGILQSHEYTNLGQCDVLDGAISNLPRMFYLVDVITM